MGYYVVGSCNSYIFHTIIILCKNINLNTGDLLFMHLYISYQGLETQFKFECPAPAGMKIQT